MKRYKTLTMLMAAIFIFGIRFRWRADSVRDVRHGGNGGLFSRRKNSRIRRHGASGAHLGCQGWEAIT